MSRTRATYVGAEQQKARKKKHETKENPSKSDAAPGRENKSIDFIDYRLSRRDVGGPVTGCRFMLLVKRPGRATLVRTLGKPFANRCASTATAQNIRAGHGLPEGRFWKGFIYNLLRRGSSNLAHMERNCRIVTQEKSYNIDLHDSKGAAFISSRGGAFQ